MENQIEKSKIEDYLAGKLSNEETIRLMNDEEFLKELDFYILFQGNKVSNPQFNIIKNSTNHWKKFNKLIISSAAAIFIIFLSIFYMVSETSQDTLGSKNEINRAIHLADSLYKSGDTLRANLILEPYMGDIEVEKYLNTHSNE